MAGFGYGAKLSAVVCWDSKTFWQRPWESRPRLFFSERSNVILCNWLLFSRVWFICQEWDLIPTGSTVVFPCASVQTAPLRSLNASAVCAMIAEGSDRNSLMLLCKHGVRPRSHLWFFHKRVLYSLITQTRFTANFSILLTPSDETTVLSVLIQAFWQFWNVALVQSLCSLPLLLWGKTFLWLYWTRWKIRTVLHDVHDDHGWVGNPLLMPDNVVSLSHCLTLVQQYLPRAYEETRRKNNSVTFHSRWEMKVYFILYLSVK